MGGQGLPRRREPWGGSRATLGHRGAPSAATFGKQTALQNPWLYMVHFGFPRGCWGTLGGPGGPFGCSKVGALGGLMFLLVPLGARRCSWGALGGPGGPPLGDSLGELGPSLRALGEPWGGLRGPMGTLRAHFWKTDGIAKSLVSCYEVVFFGSPRGSWGALSGARSQR